MNVKTKYVVLFVLILSAVLTCFIILKTDVVNKTNGFKTFVYETETGFGYSIGYNDKLLIKQNYIPAIENNQSFCNFDDAKKVADLVKEKLNKKENPKVSLQELNKLNIQLNCSN